MENIKGKAWSFLIAHRIGTLPIDTLLMNEIDVGFKILSFKDGENIINASKKFTECAKIHKAFTTSIDGNFYIFYNTDLTYSDRNFIIAHEIGRIVLKHTSHDNILGKSENKRKEKAQEKEADDFALVFLAPSPVFAEMKIYSPTEIARITGLSSDLSLKAALEIVKDEGAKKSSIETNLIDVFRETINQYTLTPVTPVLPVLDKPKTSNMVLFSAIAIICCALLSIGLLGFGYLYRGNSTDPVDSIVTIPPNQSTELGTEGVEDMNPDLKVYVTSTGTKYHLPDCQHVRGKNNLRELTLSDAEKQNFVPCKVCKPNE